MERLTERRDAQWVIPLRNDGRYKWALCKAGMSLDDSSEYLYGDPANHLAAYENTGLGSEEITTEPYGCVFYCNRKCNLDGDFCAEGPGCPREIDAETAKHLLELAQAEKDGRLVVLPCKDYCWRIRGDIILDIIRANCRAAHEKEAALKKREDAQHEN